MRTYHVERLFTLGNYKNIKFSAGVELDESDTRSPLDITTALVDDVYEAFFQHDRRLSKLNKATPENREAAFFEGE